MISLKSCAEKRMEIRREQQSAVFLVIILLILVGIGSYLAFLLRTDFVSDSLEHDQVIKILFVLEDENKEALFTDVFIYYPLSRKGALFEIPGNTGAIYESLGRVDRIDAIYKEKGILVYKTEIEKLIGTNLQFYIKIGIDDFCKLTDLLGGLKVFIPSPVDSESEDGEELWLLPSGAVSLDGDKIAVYLRYILSDESEKEQRERQQHVMISFLEALNRNRGVFFTKKSFMHYKKFLSTSIDEDSLLYVLSEIANVDTERLQPQTVTGSSRVVDGKELIFPYYDGELIKESIQMSTTQLTASEDVNSRIYVLEIQNGTMTQGLARNTALLLQGVGYDVLTTSNADTTDYEKTVIINHIGNAAAAKSLGDFIHCSNIIDEDVRPESDGPQTDTMVDFTIILGRDFNGRYVVEK